jgi:hypothetical protein
MKANLVFKPASQDEITLYCFMGEAVCKIQTLESALSCSITIKKHSTATRAEADKALSKQLRYYTLGKAVQLAEKEKLFSLPLQTDLNDFYQKRNWLVHQTMFEHRDGLSSDTATNQLFHKIKSIANEAQKIQRAIEMDLLDFCESKGRDVSKVLAVIEEHDEERNINWRYRYPLFLRAHSIQVMSKTS